MLPSPLLLERTQQFDPQLGVVSEHFATDIAAIDQPHLGYQVAGLQVA
jgi:hypothetical protein